MGRLKAEQPSERKRAANRENARRPRGRWAGTPEREALDEAKRLLRQAIPDGARFLVELLRDPETPPELRLQAFKIAADRAGLPVLTEQHAMVESLAPIIVRTEGLKPPWLQDGEAGQAAEAQDSDNGRH